jgi:hypothetical protein
MKQPPPAKSEYAAETASAEEYSFGGFKNLNSTPIPDEFFDVLAVRLSEAELRVLLYIMRRTFGFKKKADAISLSQLTGGIRKRDGSVLDHGTGLSRPAVLKAVTGLQAKNIITIEKRTGEDGRNEINIYQLRFADEPVSVPQPVYATQKSPSPVDYSTTGHISYPSPDPRFVSARPVSPVSGRPPGPVSSAGPSSEQRQAGDFNGLEQDNFAQERDFTPGVNQLYREGKPALPGSKTSLQGGKPALPGVVNKNDRGSQNETSGRVNLVNRQHESLQESRKQNTETQIVWRSNGALAYQPSLLDEPTEVSSQPEELYINLEELAGAMYELGLSQKLTLDLIQAYPAEYLWEKVRLTRQQLQGHQPGVKNTAGYLRRAISEDYRPLPARSYKNTQSNSTNFADRFQGTLAYLNRNQTAHPPENSGYLLDNPLNFHLNNSTAYPLEEDFYPPQTAPLPPIYRQDFNSQSMPGESRSGMPPTPSLHGRRVSPLPSDGAEGPGEIAFSQPACFAPVETEAATGLWEKIYEDLEGRFRLGEALELLSGALLFLPRANDYENQVTLQLNSPWQERALGMAARSAIALAVRQRLGPGFKVKICSA